MGDVIQKRQRRRKTAAPAAARTTAYCQLKNPFPLRNAVSEDEAHAIHATSLRVLEELGMRVLSPQARAVFATGGARVNDDMVFLGRDMVEAALQSAPKSFPLKGATAARDLTLELGALTFQPGAGAPHATCRVKGRRPGTAQDFRELVQLTQAFDALHLVPTLIEPQDVPVHLRHYDMVKSALTLSDKAFFIYSRGTAQVEDAFEMMRLYRGISDADFAAAPHCYTIINTNSPRTLDIPMAQGIMDFARAGQISIITPFTLMGAMAPITPAGAITLSHAEALAAITLGQLTRPGAPQMYGTFTSNVDMKSGAPAFGTPEHFRASLLAGQLARLIGLPWRCASGSACNINDAQGANENQLALWGCLLAGATTVVHAAGWLEGGLTVSYEKLICDMDVVNAVADL
ncbi:MAG: trimethylamine methyltransferase family protein, partial [Pseudomonadota bacterium]